MKKKSIIRIYLLLIAIVAVCNIPAKCYAQATAQDQQPLEIKSAFFGNWVEVKDPDHLLEIYKEGDLVIVHRRSQANDGSGSNKYTVIYAEGNKIKVDLQSGLAPLTITDDGTKLSFLGNEYVKK